MSWERALEWVHDYVGRQGHLPAIDCIEVPSDDDAFLYCTDAAAIRAALPPEPRIDPVPRCVALNALWRLLQDPYNEELPAYVNAERQIDAEAVTTAELNRKPIEVLEQLNELYWEGAAAIAFDNWARLEAVTHRWAESTGDRIQPTKTLAKGVFSTFLPASIRVPGIGEPFEKRFVLPSTSLLPAGALSNKWTEIADITLPLLSSSCPASVGDLDRVRFGVGKASSERLLAMSAEYG